jgi:hypothetical protein
MQPCGVHTRPFTGNLFLRMNKRIIEPLAIITIPNRIKERAKSGVLDVDIM